MDPTTNRSHRLTRRRFVQATAGLGLSLAGGPVLAGCANQVAPLFRGATGTELETTRIRLPGGFASCVAPLFLAADMLRADGFTDVDYVPIERDADQIPAVSAGDVDLSTQTAAATTLAADTDPAFVHLAGLHIGCFELFAQDGIRTLTDLKGKRVAVELGSGAHVHLSVMAAYVGLDPSRDIVWVPATSEDAIAEFSAGQVDAYMGFPPEPQELRRQGVGHVIVKTHVDRPWSQYFCCMVVANRAFVQNSPVAATRALRAVMKATDLCVQQPAASAQRLIDRGVATDYDDMLQTFGDVGYDHWRDYDPADTVRFFALRLREIGMIKSDPEKLVAQSTDFRFLNELKQEMKA